MSRPTSPPEALLERLRAGDRFLLTSHVNPDGDAIGTELGLARLLRQMGKTVTIWNRDPVPGLYDMLPGADRIHVGEDPPGTWPDAVDTVVVLECPSPDRSGLEQLWGPRPVLNVDHHLGNTLHGAVNWIDTAAPAVGEMVFRVASAFRLTLDPDTANCLYVAMVTDTGGFRYSNTTAETFDAAAGLVRAGADPAVVSGWLYESRSASAVRLLAECLSTLEMHQDGRVATVVLDREMIERAGARPGDSEGLIDHPRSIAGVEAAALFRQLPEGGGWKVSLRSKGRVDVEKIARRFGGGGHHNAAGFSSSEPTKSLRQSTLAALESALELV